MTETSSVLDELRLIKRSLRGVMNGVVSTSMRDKGLNYKVNFGVELPRLVEMSREMTHSYELAAALWKEDIRECRLLAAMLMPSERFDEDLADLWIEQMRFTEEAETTVMYLFSRTPWASTKAFQWLAAEEEMPQLCAYLLLARLFMKGCVLSSRDEIEYLDHTATTLQGKSLRLRSAAGKALTKYMNLGPLQERKAEDLLYRLEQSIQ